MQGDSVKTARSQNFPFPYFRAIRLSVATVRGGSVRTDCPFLLSQFHTPQTLHLKPLISEPNLQVSLFYFNTTMRLRARYANERTCYDSASDECDVDSEDDDARLQKSPDADDDLFSITSITNANDDTLSQISDDDTICVVVGREPNKWKFFMDPYRICCCSKFFRDALRGGWKSAQTLEVTLKEEKPRIFAWYLDTLYVRTLTRSAYPYLG